jgi:hypothetical protein
MAATALSNADWGKIHARAYKDDVFRSKLETDPTGAVKEWFVQEYGKDSTELDRILDLSEWLKTTQNAQGDWPPPACC